MNDKWIIEVDITHRCNMACRHCNRLCNAENLYGTVRDNKDMKEKHIDFLCHEIKKLPAGKIHLLRIVGGEPLLSNIISYTIEKFRKLQTEGYTDAINIVTNGTVKLPDICKPYVVYAPVCVGVMIKDKGRTLTTKDVYAIKNHKHRNITVSPLDFNMPYEICDRIRVCGIHYSVYGFSYTAACFPVMFVAQQNHKRFLPHLPNNIGEFFDAEFSQDVCSLCAYAIANYQKLANEDSSIQSIKHTGKEWRELILANKQRYVEPNTAWIDKVEFQL